MRIALLILVAIAAAFGSDLQNLRTQLRTSHDVPLDMPELRDKSYGQFSPAPKIAADRVSFYTDYDVRVPAIVYHQDGASILRRPALIIVNATGGDKASSYAYTAGILFARAGAVVLTYDSLGEFERNKERRSGTNQSQEVVQPQAEMSKRLKGLLVSDVLQSAHYLSSRKDVDSKRIAILGFDAGSETSAFACALDAHIDACVLSNQGDSDIAPLIAKRTLISANPLSREVALWLNDRLKFPNWMKKQIEAMPETLEAGIPKISRDDLHAVPDAVWISEQELFVYETWVRRAEAAIRNAAP